MEIKVVSGIGRGETKLAAFDNALFKAGIENFNLVPLSSVIPPKAEVVVCSRKLNFDSSLYGNRMYVVMAQKGENHPGQQAVAGLGWVLEEHGNYGIFVEHEGGSVRQVRRLIYTSLKTMMFYRPEEFGEIKMKVVRALCYKRPACALVAAIYKVESW